MKSLLWIILVDYVCTFIFCLEGAIIAERNDLSIFGCFFSSLILGFGGGITRDLLLNRSVAFLFNNLEANLLLGIVACIVIMLFKRYFKKKYSLFCAMNLVLLDSFSIPIFTLNCIFILQNEIIKGSSSYIPLLIIMPVINCIGGGVIVFSVIERKIPSAFKTFYTISPIITSMVYLFTAEFLNFKLISTLITCISTGFLLCMYNYFKYNNSVHTDIVARKIQELLIRKLSKTKTCQIDICEIDSLLSNFCLIRQLIFLVKAKLSKTLCFCFHKKQYLFLVDNNSVIRIIYYDKQNYVKWKLIHSR